MVQKLENLLNIYGFIMFYVCTLDDSLCVCVPGSCVVSTQLWLKTFKDTPCHLAEIQPLSDFAFAGPVGLQWACLRFAGH